MTQSSVITIGETAFFGCTGLTSIIVDENNINYCSVDGNLFNKAKTELIQYAIGKSNAQYAIPSGVMSIDRGAFEDCKNLTSITIPSGVTSIGGHAFENCTGLTSVNITDIAAWCNIDFGGYANPLYYAKKLYLNGDLVTDLVIPNGVTAVKAYAFENCSDLTNVIIPEGVTSIGEEAFRGCENLTSITIPSGVTSIDYRAFENCLSLTSVTIPSGVTSIGEYAFNNCTGLTSVTIPDSVTSIGEYAFNNCTGLKNVNITDIAAWCNIDFGGYANPLYYAKRLYLNGDLVNDLIIPSGVTTIGIMHFIIAEA